MTPVNNMAKDRAAIDEIIRERKRKDIRFERISAIVVLLLMWPFLLIGGTRLIIEFGFAIKTCADVSAAMTYMIHNNWHLVIGMVVMGYNAAHQHHIIKEQFKRSKDL